MSDRISELLKRYIDVATYQHAALNSPKPFTILPDEAREIVGYLQEIAGLKAQLAELRNTANYLARSAKIVSNSVNNDEYIPGFRYRQFEDGIIKVRELTAKHQ